MNACRASLVVTACFMMAVWTYTGAAQAARQQTLRLGAADAARRFVGTEESLTTIRGMVLLTSARVRDALLEPESGDLFEDRRQIDAAYRLAQGVLEDYAQSAGADERLSQLSAEVERLHGASVEALREGAASGPDLRELLNRRILPLRDAALGSADAMQSRNRDAFIVNQVGIAAAHDAADARGRHQLGLALIAGLIAMLLASTYAGRLEARLHHGPALTI